jgi:hypothetical protein
MRITTFIFSFALFLAPMTIMAGNEHNHDHGHGHSHEPATQEQAEHSANDIVLKLVENGKIESSWKSTPVNEARKKKFGDTMEWVITFTNEKVADPEKQTLYIFLSLAGEYIAANFSGN